MPLASLAVGSPSWRAARAAAALGCLARGDAAPDDVLGALAKLGGPPRGWWETLVHARGSAALGLALPRPGDPRGLLLPRGIAAEAACGWGDSDGSTWLLAGEGESWELLTLPDHPLARRDTGEAHRLLRAAVVDAAHAVDGMLTEPGPGEADARRQHDAIVHAWVSGPAGLPTSSRPLADLGLRMLLAIDAGRRLTDVTALESAARSAVEAAYSTPATAR